MRGTSEYGAPVALSQASKQNGMQTERQKHMPRRNATKQPPVKGLNTNIVRGQRNTRVLFFTAHLLHYIIYKKLSGAESITEMGCGASTQSSDSNVIHQQVCITVISKRLYQRDMLEIDRMNRL